MDIIAVINQFSIEGKITNAQPFGTGHINDTFLIETDRQKYVLQRINHEVFKNPTLVMENIALVCEAQARALENFHERADRQVLTLVFTTNQQPYWQDDKGNTWRVYVYVPDTVSFEIITNTKQAYQAGKGFGKFQRLLSGLNPNLLHDTIPKFHHLGWRYEQLETAIEKDIAGRKQGVENEIAFVLQRKNLAVQLAEALATGLLPLRATHNDTKISNLLFDRHSEEGICVIDLDTVMAGSVIYDFGDLVRTSLSLSAEDETDLSKVQIRMEVFEALTKGYLHEAKHFITDSERERLVFGGKIITLIMAVRFLTDYLSGDVYYKIKHEYHNLDRCRTQLRLVEQIEAREKEMLRLIHL